MCDSSSDHCCTALRTVVVLIIGLSAGYYVINLFLASPADVDLKRSLTMLGSNEDPSNDVIKRAVKDDGDPEEDVLGLNEYFDYDPDAYIEHGTAAQQDTNEGTGSGDITEERVTVSFPSESLSAKTTVDMTSEQLITSTEYTYPGQDMLYLTPRFETTTVEPNYASGSDEVIGSSPDAPVGESPVLRQPSSTGLKEPPASWKPNPTIFTSTQVQKIAEEYLNSMEWHSTSDAGGMTDAPAPGTSSSPRQQPDSEENTSETKAETVTEAKENDYLSDSVYSRYNIPTVRPLPPVCLREGYQIKRVCDLSDVQKSVKGDNVTLEDIALMMFVKSTLNALKVRTQ